MTTRFGALLEGIPKEKDETDGDLAEKLGVSRQHYSNMKSGGVFVSPKAALKYCKKLGISEQEALRTTLQDKLDQVSDKYLVCLQENQIKSEDLEKENSETYEGRSDSGEMAPGQTQL